MRRASDIDPYEVLGLSPTADDVVVRAAWKALMRKYHPDTSGAPDAAERAARINAAFKLLAPGEARAAYDRSRSPAPSPQPAPFAAPVRSPAPPPRPKRSRTGKRAIAALAVLLAGGSAVYAAHVGGVLALPAPLEQSMARPSAIDLSFERLGAGARRLAGLDAAAQAVPLPPARAEAPPPAIDRSGIGAAIAGTDPLAGEDRRRSCTELRDWAALDLCSALDFVALAQAQGLFERAEPGAGFFAPATQPMRDRYAAVSDDDEAIGTRLDTIRMIVWSTMLAKYETRLRERYPPLDGPSSAAAAAR